MISGRLCQIFFLPQVLCSLKDLNWERSSKIDMAVDISKYTRWEPAPVVTSLAGLSHISRNSLGDKGSELLLSVCYNPTISRLTINVLEAKDLRSSLINFSYRFVSFYDIFRCTTNNDDHALPDTYVRVSLNMHTKVLEATYIFRNNVLDIEIL